MKTQLHIQLDLTVEPSAVPRHAINKKPMMLTQFRSSVREFGNIKSVSPRLMHTAKHSVEPIQELDFEYIADKERDYAQVTPSPFHKPKDKFADSVYSNYNMQFKYMVDHETLYTGVKTHRIRQFRPKQVLKPTLLYNNTFTGPKRIVDLHQGSISPFKYSLKTQEIGKDVNILPDDRANRANSVSNRSKFISYNYDHSLNAKTTIGKPTISSTIPSKSEESFSHRILNAKFEQVPKILTEMNNPTIYQNENSYDIESKKRNDEIREFKKLKEEIVSKISSMCHDSIYKNSLKNKYSYLDKMASEAEILREIKMITNRQKDGSNGKEHIKIKINSAKKEKEDNRVTVMKKKSTKDMRVNSLRRSQSFSEKDNLTDNVSIQNDIQMSNITYDDYHVFNSIPKGTLESRFFEN